MTTPEQWEPHRRRLQDLVKVAAQLTETITERAERERRIDQTAFGEGYRLGFLSGREVGYRQAEEEMAQEWARLAAEVRRMARFPSFAELQVRRNTIPPAPTNRPGSSRADRGRAA